MGKVLKVVAVIAVAAAISYLAPYLAPQILSALGTTTATALATAVVTATVATALSIAASAAFAMLAGRPSTSASPSVFRQSIANSFIIYGKRRVGGLLIFFHPRGKEYRYFVIAAAGHQCKGVTRWFLGDEVVTVDGAGKVTSGKYANNAWLWFYRGTDDQVAHPTFVAETEGKWTVNHRGRRTALIYAKFKMTNDVVQAGMPNITAEIEGKDDILDPRTDVRGYTRNAALVFYDWLAMAREEGGFGAYEDEIDWDWVSAQANVCDEVVSTPAGPEHRYEFDSYIQTGAAPSEVRDTFVTCCAGKFTYTSGKMLMRPGYYVPPSNTLLEEDLAGPFTVPALLSGDEIATEVTGTYVEPSMYQPMDVPTRTATSSDIRQSTYDLPHITSHYRGQRILEYYLRKSQAERRVSWPMNIMGIAISTLDTVQLATSKYGLSNYAFQVTGWGLNQDFSVGLALEEHNPDLFEFDAGSYHAIGTEGALTPADPIEDGSQAPTLLTLVATTTDTATISARAPTTSSFEYMVFFAAKTSNFADAVPITAQIVDAPGAVRQVQEINVEAGLRYYWAVAYTDDDIASDPTGPVAANLGAFDFSTGSLPTGAALTRASTANYRNSTGVLTLAAVDVARFNYQYDTATNAWTIGGILNEGAATNLALRSQDLTNASWIKSASTAPSATRLVENNTSATHHAEQSIAVTSGQTYCLSVEAAEVGGSAKRYLGLLLPTAAFGANRFAKFDLATGSVTSLSAGVTAGMTAIGAGKWLCWIVATATATVTTTPRIHLVQTGTGTGFTYTGDAASTLDISNMQFEAGLAVTSRIITAGAAVTRAADVLVLDWFTSRHVPDGMITVRYTFSDLTTQDVAATVASGHSTVPTNLNRRTIRKVERV